MQRAAMKRRTEGIAQIEIPVFKKIADCLGGAGTSSSMRPLSLSQESSGMANSGRAQTQRQTGMNASLQAKLSGLRNFDMPSPLRGVEFRNPNGVAIAAGTATGRPRVIGTAATPDRNAAPMIAEPRNGTHRRLCR